jgi:hypothetical protein
MRFRKKARKTGIQRIGAEKIGIETIRSKTGEIEHGGGGNGNRKARKSVTEMNVTGQTGNKERREIGQRER